LRLGRYKTTSSIASDSISVFSEVKSQLLFEQVFDVCLIFG